MQLNDELACESAGGLF